MSKSENNSSKTNGLGTDPLQRLASFKAPRDLSLGGVKPNKKVFVPNLNVTRNKNKGVPTTNTRDQKKDDNRNKRDRINDRNKNFKIGSNVIKADGVFSQGLGAIEKQCTRVSYGREDSHTNTLQKPTIRVKDVIKIDKELEDEKINMVFAASGNDNIEIEDFKNILDKDAPIKLPMDDASLYSHHKPAVKVKKEVVVVKTEPSDDVDSTMPVVDRTAVPDIKEEIFEDTDVVNILRNEKPTLILFQFPDSLPGCGGSSESDGHRKNISKSDNQPSTSTDEDKGKPAVDNRCHLSSLEEGRVGRLRVHRSGRVTLALGETIFEVCSGTKASFHQEVVSVAVDDASRSANLVALGPLQHKLNLLPDWETMFSDMMF